MKRRFLFFLTCIIAIKLSVAQIPYPGGSPGAAKVKILPDSSVILENNVMKMNFVNKGTGIKIEGFEDKITHERLEIGKTTLFDLTLADNSILTSEDFTLQGSPETLNITADPNSKTYAERLSGKRYKAIFENKKLGLIVRWEADLRDSTNYIRQIFTFLAKASVNLSKITLIKLPVKTGIAKMGTVDGSPLVHKNMFFALEHPMS